MYKKTIAFCAFLMLLLFPIFTVNAQFEFPETPIIAGDDGTDKGGLLPTETGKGSKCGEYTDGCGNYSLNDMVQVAVNISNWILSIVGSLSLLMFVYGGFTFVFSAGNTETVTRGKQILISAVIGLIIVFTSYMIIKFTIEALNPTKEASFSTTEK